MSTAEKIKVLELIKRYCKPSKYYYKWSSYALKEVFERLANCYISNKDFKELMQEAGFTPTPRSKSESNHRYMLKVTVCPEISIYYWGQGSEVYKYENKKGEYG